VKAGSPTVTLKNRVSTGLTSTRLINLLNAVNRVEFYPKPHRESR
jgi:hypothetical protein